jgi:hypothetical protein
MAWTNLSPTLTPAAWNVTDLDLVKRITYFMLENGAVDATGSTVITSMFTVGQMVDVLNLAQERFMRDCTPILTRAGMGSTPQVARYALPSDWIWTRRLTWQGFQGLVKSMARVDAYELDHGLSDWQQNFANPTMYNDGSDLPTLTVELAKAPSGPGTMTLLYQAQPVALTGLGASLSVPDECESAILYGALAELLGSDGEAFDPQRAQYCEDRYQLAVQLTNTLLGGFNG